MNKNSSEEAKIRSINESLDSGLGDGTDDNRPFWEDYTNPIFNKSYLENNPDNFYNALLFKVDARKVLKLESGTVQSVFIKNYSVSTLATQEDKTSSLLVTTLDRCTIVFPYDSLRMLELRNF